MNKIIIIFLVVLFSFSVISTEEGSVNEARASKLMITNFVEASKLKEAGAITGDILKFYNGQQVISLKQLSELKEDVKSNDVEVVVIREGTEHVLTTSKGALGVYLREYAPEHEIKDDAVIIVGLGALGWGIGMENSFLGCLTLLEDKFGNSFSYADLTGLSGYGFRTHFFGGY